MEMKRVFLAVLLSLWTLVVDGQSLVVSNGSTWGLNGSSYSTAPHLWGATMATYAPLNDPAKTNRWFDPSRGGSSWLGDYQNQQYKWCVPFWANAPADIKYFVGANDNGGGVSNDIVVWGPLIASATNTLYNGTTTANDFTFTTLKTYFIGENPHDSAGGDGGSKSRDAGCDYLASFYGTPQVHEWLTLSNAGWIGNITYGAGSHPDQGGLLARTITTLVALGADTNVASWVADWDAVQVTTNHCVASSVSKVGSILSFTLRYDRMPIGWPVPDGTITNDARNCFTAMPSLGNAFLFTIQGTNLPLGNFSVAVDGQKIGKYTTAQLVAGVNWFTNYVGPLWQQRLLVFKKTLDLYGKDYVTFSDSHTAGEAGNLGVGDFINYFSDANGQYDNNGLRGSTFVTAMATDIAHLDKYYDAMHAAAQQTDHTITITLIGDRMAPIFIYEDIKNYINDLRPGSAGVLFSQGQPVSN